MPHDVTPKQLETLLNGLLRQEEKLPYSFFVQEQQLSEELGAHLLKNKVQSPLCHILLTHCLHNYTLCHLWIFFTRFSVET